MLYKLKYINERGESIEFKGNQYDFQEPIEFKNKTTNPFNLIRFEGFGEVGANVQLQKAPFQDGSTHIDTRLQERNPYLEFVIVADDWSNLSNYRKHVARVFNPKINGRFELSYDDKTYVLESIPENVPFFADEDAVGKSQVVSVNFVCPNPYWKSPTIQEEPMAAFVELFEFPSDYWTVGADGDLYFEMGTEGHTRTFVNKGDSSVPIKIRIKGPTANPCLTNLTTGELIKVRRQLGADDVLEINTEDGNKSVLLNGENAFNWIDLSSTFFKLEVGENTLQFTADSGQESASLEIEWQEQFVGV